MADISALFIGPGAYFIGLLVFIAFEARRYKGDINAYKKDFGDTPLPLIRAMFWPITMSGRVLFFPFALAWRLGSPRPVPPSPPKPTLVDVGYREQPEVHKETAE